jgi:hypothetical protein
MIDAMGDQPVQIAQAMTIASLPALVLVVVLWFVSIRRYDVVRIPIFEADALGR